MNVKRPKQIGCNHITFLKLILGCLYLMACTILYIGDEGPNDSDSNWSMECSTVVRVKTLHISSPILAAKSPFFYKVNLMTKCVHVFEILHLVICIFVDFYAALFQWNERVGATTCNITDKCIWYTFFRASCTSISVGLYPHISFQLEVVISFHLILNASIWVMSYHQWDTGSNGLR